MMWNRWMLSAVVLVACWGCDPAGTDGPDEPGNDQGLTPPAVNPDPDLDTTLAGMEQAGKDFPAIAADIVYHVDQEMTGDSEHRTGSVKYDAGSEDRSPRFYVGFDTVQLGDGPTVAAKVEYAFDGRWLTIAKHNLKQMTRYEAVREGDKVEMFKLGQGPFPLPFGQRAAVLKEYFEIAKIDRAESDPENTVHLRFVRKPGREEDINFTKLDLWVDVVTFLPVTVISVDDGENVTTAIFENIDTTYVPADSDFLLPRKAGWEVITERLDG